MLGEMLSEMVNYSIGAYNFKRHLAGYKGSLLSALGNKVSEPMGLWRGYPCYRLYFICDDGGFLCRLGAWQDFSEKETETYNPGRFRIALDQARIHAAERAGSTNSDFPHELILDSRFYKQVPTKIKERIRETAVLYNLEFGFEPDYNDNFNGFTAGNLLDDDSLRAR